jgi:hypothetical protein
VITLPGRDLSNLAEAESFLSGAMTRMDDFLDSWIDPGEILPWLPKEPYISHK